MSIIQQPHGIGAGAGFLLSWRANDLNTRVMDKIHEIANAPGASADRFGIFLTGNLCWLMLAGLSHMTGTQPPRYRERQVPTFLIYHECCGAGHSLGGALATLAAVDIRNRCDQHDRLKVSVYTFGAPRWERRSFRLIT